MLGTAPIRFALAGVALVLAAAVACGSDSDETPAPEETGGAGAEEPVECAGIPCDPVILPGDLPNVEACCASNGECGLDGTPLAEYGVLFDEPCQARNQPGVLDADCPDSPAIEVPNLGMATFAGCCTPSGRCGYLLNDVARLIVLNLGCVDSTPFLDGGVAPDCEP